MTVFVSAKLCAISFLKFSDIYNMPWQTLTDIHNIHPIYPTFWVKSVRSVQLLNVNDVI